MSQKRKVVICTPTITRPLAPYIKALEDSIQLVIDAGWDEAAVFEVGCPYISQARATMTRKALDARADVLVFIDHDLSWEPNALLKLIETEGEVVCGNYRFKKDDEEYMGELVGTPDAPGSNMGRPTVRADGCVKASLMPAGFLKVTKEAINTFMVKYPELSYGPVFAPTPDLFNHGAKNRIWWGEDYAFCRNMADAGVDVWCIPNLDIDHHNIAWNTKTKEWDHKVYKGNYHRWLLRQPGGSASDNPVPPK